MKKKLESRVCCKAMNKITMVLRNDFDLTKDGGAAPCIPPPEGANPSLFDDLSRCTGMMLAFKWKGVLVVMSL